MAVRFLYIFLLTFSFFACKNNIQTTAIKGVKITVDNSISSDPEIEEYIKPYAQHLNQTLDSILAYNPNALNKNDGELNSPLGNLMADLVMEQANPIFNSRTGNSIDVVILNHGAIRSGIGMGHVTTRTGFQLMPFENEIVIVELSGNKIMEMIGYLGKSKTSHPISGMELKVDKDFNTISATINNKPILKDNTYFVATSDYLQQGGDNMNFFQDPIALFDIDYKLRNAIIDHFKKVDTLRTSIDNRFIQIP